MNILQAIGNTSIVRLRKVVPLNCADILVKLEWRAGSRVRKRSSRERRPVQI